mmetsp:Transcript_21719/g.60331  ORF Transcript_21719/g.60331 Transcript_21719/m.60331 type:complete len:104 (-) Transcript_21719:812-1123(-)
MGTILPSVPLLLIQRARLSLLYVIRQKEQQEVMTSKQRSGTVGKDGTFSSWMEYNVQCAALEGPQFTTDNHAVWVLLCNAVQDGPAWAYLHRHKDSNESTGNT